MAHKTLISGTAYSVTGGRELIGGTGYGCKAGKTLIGGTAFDVPFSKGIPLSSVTPGAILYLNESGSPVPFYVAKHDYESGLNGAGRTLVVRKDCGAKMYFRGSWSAYVGSYVDERLTGTYFDTLDADIQAAVGTTKIYYTPGNNYGSGDYTVTTLQRTVFLLSLTEFGKTDSEANTEGTALPIASLLGTAYYENQAVGQWTRTPVKNQNGMVFIITKDGNYGTSYTGTSWTASSYGCRPAFTLPANLALAKNADGTYTLAA